MPGNVARWSSGPAGGAAWNITRGALENPCRGFPAAARRRARFPLPVFHVVGGGDYYSKLPGYQKTLKLAGPSPKHEPVVKDSAYEALERFRAKNVFVGERNWPM